MSIPDPLKNIPQPPKNLYYKGSDINELLKRPRLAVVGSRKITPYGKQVTRQLVGALAERGVVIISGLAFGVDYEAHRAALDAGGLTIAVLPSPVDKAVPRSHHRLAQEIVDKGGLLVSEYPSGTESLKGNFVERNRLVSGLSDAVLITEAASKSGSLHTADFALQQGRDILAVPGNINSLMSVGTNRLIKEGATPIMSASDVLFALNLDETKLERFKPQMSLDPSEETIVKLIKQGISNGEDLRIQAKMDISTLNGTLTMLELSGVIRAVGSNNWALC